MHQWTGSLLLPVMACRVLGAKQTRKPIPTFGIRARAALSCVGGKNAGGSARPHTQCSMCIDPFYQWYQAL